MTNAEVKRELKRNEIAYWQVAEIIGVSDMTIQRWLRSERDTRNQHKIIAALEELKAKEAAANE